MARFLVRAAETLAGRDVLDRVLTRLVQDGHLATAVDDEADVLEALRATDAVIAILDGDAPAAAGAFLAYASSQHKPTLGLVQSGTTLPRVLRSVLDATEEGDRVDDWLEALPNFYPKVRPFAGRLVRDFIPDLVKEAGHQVTFRPLGDDEKPRFLKEKVLAEAHQLRDADLGAEKEEIADLLEALETLIRTRGHDRDSLKQIKDAKRKRRGGFERGWVVEETQGTGVAPSAPAPDLPDPTVTPPTPDADEENPAFTL